MSTNPRSMVPLPLSAPIWGAFFTVAPLVLVGTREEDDSHDLAPKHMAMPLGWQNHFGFVCHPSHATQRNAARTGAFTVSFPRPDSVVQVALAAEGRAAGGKPSLDAIPVSPATVVDGVLVDDAHLWLECELDRVIDGFGENTLIAGRVVAAAVAEGAHSRLRRRRRRVDRRFAPPRVPGAGTLRRRRGDALVPVPGRLPPIDGRSGLRDPRVVARAHRRDDRSAGAAGRRRVALAHAGSAPGRARDSRRRARRARVRGRTRAGNRGGQPPARAAAAAGVEGGAGATARPSSCSGTSTPSGRWARSSACHCEPRRGGFTARERST